VVGGRGFGADGRWAARLGAAWASDAPSAAELIADERALRRVPAARLSHLADDEYASLVRRRGELIDSALTDLRERVPATREYTAAQLDSTVSDLGHIVDALAAALYVDDASLFIEFVEWLVGILSSRGVPASAVGLTLQHYATVLRDFPRAAHALTLSRAALPTADSPPSR
ncbi:MAG: cobalamin-binding protein, partial [Actinoplanes sp.]